MALFSKTGGIPGLTGGICHLRTGGWARLISTIISIPIFTTSFSAKYGQPAFSSGFASGTQLAELWFTSIANSILATSSTKWGCFAYGTTNRPCGGFAYGAQSAELWFTYVAISPNPMNVLVNQGRLEIRRSFFSVRAMQERNEVPAETRGFKLLQDSRRLMPSFVPCQRKQTRDRIKENEHNATRMFSERPSWGHGGLLLSKT